jgi:hypothetical protein
VLAEQFPRRYVIMEAIYRGPQALFSLSMQLDVLGIRLTRQRKEAHRVGLFVFIVDGADEHVVRDVVEVASVLKPWACHRDVISCALALGLDQHLCNTFPS